MGSFEKLGILVIVVIIVMILAVAIHQWGGTPADASAGEGSLARGFVPGSITPGPPGPLERDLGGAEGLPQQTPPGGDGAAVDPALFWPGGIPRSYTIQKDDVLWKLVVQTWKLKESYTRAIEASNPKMNAKRLKVGETIIIPDPAPYRDGAPTREASTPPAGAGTATYEVQAGDSFESIAKKLLGSSLRWKEVQALNPGIKPRALQQGQMIVVPIK